jgi:hypothetical protein
MADEPLQQILDEMRTRIQAELDAKIESLRAREAETLSQARQQVEADADARWTSKLEAVRTEWAARLDSEVAAANAEAEKRLVAETMRLRGELDQAVAAERERVSAEAAAGLAARVEEERARAAVEVDAERQRSASLLDAERERVEQELEQARAAFKEERARLEREIQAERDTYAQLEAEVRQAERAAQAQRQAGPEVDAVLRATRVIDASRSLSDTLTALVRGALEQAPRAAVFILNGTRMDEWPAPGVERLSPSPIERDLSGLLRAALTRGSRASAPDDGSAPSFARLPEGRAASAVPLTIDGQAVAVLYADEGVSSHDEQRSGWADVVELLTRHASARLAELTAARSLQLLGGNGRRHARLAPQDDEQSARRYAKLLVSEIKLYNEGAVRVGRERHDLLQRLHVEIDRARRLYDERVSSTVAGRASYFQQELVQTLAGGDPSLLGS